MLLWGLSGAAGVLGIIAIICDLQQVYFVAVTVAAVPWLSRLLSTSYLAGLRASVQTTGEIQLSRGESRSMRMMVYNTGRVPRALCRAELRLPGGLEATTAGPRQVDTLPPEGYTQLDVAFTAARRGCYRIEGARLRTTDVLGIFEFSVDVDELDVEVVVRPRVLKLTADPRLLVERVGTMADDPAAVYDADRSGIASLEFYGVREYVPGDELRRVHWPTTARLGKLSVIEFVKQQEGAVSIVLDLERRRHGGGDGDGGFEWAVTFAATLAVAASKMSVPVRLIAVGAEDWSYAPDGGTADPEPILDRLARVADHGQVPLDQVVGGASLMGDGSQVILIAASAGGATARAVDLLQSTGRAVRTVVVEATSFEAEAPGVEETVGEQEPREPLRPGLTGHLTRWVDRVVARDWRLVPRRRPIAGVNGEGRPGPWAVRSPAATYQPAADPSAVVFRAGDDPVAFLEQA